MNSNRNWGIYWPTHEQELLLRASFLQGEDALTAWHHWRAAIDIECLDPESYHLLGLLYRNLSSHQVNDSHMAKLKGIYRSRWYANQLLFQKVIAILHSFHDAGIETLVLKDAAIVSHYYQDYGLRPMSTLDFLIPPVDASAAMRFLRELGWIPEIKRLDRFVPLSPAVVFRNESRQLLMLHKHVFWEGFPEHVNNTLWSSAILTQIGDFSTRVFSPTDQLLYVCFRGFQWNPVLQIRWVADAMMIINSSKVAIDWGQLVRQAQQCRLVLPLKNMLTILHEVLGEKIPVSMLQDTQAMPVSQFEHFEYQVSNRKPLPVVGPSLTKAFRYLKLVKNADLRFRF